MTHPYQPPWAKDTTLVMRVTPEVTMEQFQVALRHSVADALSRIAAELRDAADIQARELPLP